MDIEAGRIEFETRPIDRDYSGLSIADRYLSSANIEKSFFNGANLRNCAFENVKLNNTEFSEARAEQCSFVNSNLSGSDFVDSLFEGTLFDNCSFEKGEWRDATFRRCRFIACNLDHTTVTLCTFINCEFDRASLTTAEHRAVYYNVFSQCRFERPTSDVHFSSRNFGIPTVAAQSALVHADTRVSVEQMCLLNNVGKLRSIDVANVVETICDSLRRGIQRRSSTLTLYSKIVRTLTTERRISATTLIYLEQVITRFAASLGDQDLFTAAMAAVVEIRSALFAVASEPPPVGPETNGIARHVTIHFDESYTRHQAEMFRDALAESSGVDRGGLVIQEVRIGSTFIEMASATVISMGGLLIAFNFVLRQAKITIQRLDELRQAADKLKRGKQERTKRPRNSGRRGEKLPAVMQTGPVSRELAPVRAAVNRSGKLLVEMDEAAEVRISVQQMYGRG